MAQVYEVVFMTEEAYYSVGWFSVKEEADQVVTVGNEGLSDPPDRYHGFESREHPVASGDAPWTLKDVKVALAEHIYEFDDWFKYEDGEDDD